MALIETEFHPGLVLYEVVVGSLKANGTPFETWCKKNGISPTAARNALKGVSTGPVGKAMVQRLIDGAGRKVVSLTYRSRMEKHVDGFKPKSPQSAGVVV